MILWARGLLLFSGDKWVLETVYGSCCIIRHLEFDQHPELHTYLIVEKGL